MSDWLASDGAPRGALQGLIDGAMDIAAVKDWLLAFAGQTRDHAILLLDREMTVLWANPGAERILAVPAARMVGDRLHRFFTPEDLALGIPEHEIVSAARRGNSDNDRWMVRADGSRFWASGKTVALFDGAGGFVGMLKILRNQTDIKMRLDTLQNRVVALGEADNARMMAIATLAHEVRNPLSVMGLSEEVVARYCVDPVAQRALHAIRTSIERIARLTDDMEQTSRLDGGKMVLELGPVVLHEAIDAAVETAMARAGHPRRAIECILPPGQQIVLHADRLRLHQVFVNLVGNAIKFTADGGHLWIIGTLEGTQAVVRFTDDGMGIGEDVIAGIFGMFIQAPGSEQQAGMGIGLALVKGLVELHGGSVQARSDGPGKGAEFTVRLPLQPVPSGA